MITINEIYDHNTVLKKKEITKLGQSLPNFKYSRHYWTNHPKIIKVIQIMIKSSYYHQIHDQDSTSIQIVIKSNKIIRNIIIPENSEQLVRVSVWTRQVWLFCILGIFSHAHGGSLRCFKRHKGKFDNWRTFSYNTVIF